MANPTDRFEPGDTVAYTPAHMKGGETEQGVVSSKNEAYVFVKYARIVNGKAKISGAQATIPDTLKFIP